MKNLKLLLLTVLVSFSYSIKAQTADEILDNYFENTGGKAQWAKLNGIKMYAKINQNGMEIPLEVTQLKDGRQMSVIKFQGKEIKQGVYDGETLWGVNFMTQKAEKSDQETTDNMKLEANDFPNPFFNYKQKNYTVELMGKETIDGTETFKIKLVTEPVTVDGKKEESVSYYFFDTENFVPLSIETEVKSGQFKGMTSEIKMSDYEEVDGLYFPFSMIQGIKGQESGSITIDKIELNPKVDASEFKFPVETETAKPAEEEKK
jgi:outer membrane lipoprotein-sorting protein